MDTVKGPPERSSATAAAAAAVAAACYGSATTVVAMHPFDPMASSSQAAQCVPPSMSAASPASAASTTSPASAGSLFDPGPATGSASASNTSACFGTIPSFREHDPASGSRDPDGRSSSFSSVVTAGTSPAAATAAGATGASAKEIELQRKRARDRKSQQAMRDRTKWTIANLNEQVAFLTQVLNARVRDVNLINTRLQSLEVENAQLRTQNAALQLSLMGTGGRADAEPDDLATTAAAAAAVAAAAAADPAPVVGNAPEALPGSAPGPEGNAQVAGSVSPATALSLADAALVKKPWEVPPIDGPPTCLSDQILQGFITAKIQERSTNGSVPVSLKPNLCSLLEKDQRTSDPISDVVGDIVRTYFEIDTIPKQVAVFYIMCTLLKWLTLLNKESWDRLPAWLRPTWSQITTPHAAWIDRIPWPNVRNYLIVHPDITLDHFAAVYSTSFGVRWPYDHSHVLIKCTTPDEDVTINPVYEEHIMQLSNWDVGKAFRDRYPEIAAIIDSDGSLSDQPASPYNAKASTTL